MRGSTRRFQWSAISALAGVAAITLCFSEISGRPFPAGGKLVRNNWLGGTPSVAGAPGPDVSKIFPRSEDWLDHSLLSPAALRGKVVLVNFWTYTCINSLRPLPYLGAWADKYRDRGLVVVGVHTPEFAFERERTNVERATGELGITYPVVLDSKRKIWNAFGNQAWPGFFLIGPDGTVRAHWAGEGDYDRAERTIAELLAIPGQPSAWHGAVIVEGKGVQAAPDWADQHSPETYLGYAKATRSASAGEMVPDVAQRYSDAGALSLNQWALIGPWTVANEFAQVNASAGRIQYRFHARDLHLVLGVVAGRSSRFRVRIDGLPPGNAHGSDVAQDGTGIVHDNRLYQLVRQRGPIKDRLFEIEFLDPGARAYAFTFG